ncbi:hypothetical protein COY28_05645 [Candidatus Woesearchaeota archaeon CG_4_10_14_0_2_um_filter_57_5]|nr:MAG: hypothetical protein COY28_05645 [Candidatus Woesearchaeota archaeon CG_4_10_14_0_2_um_filter_57_5]
MAMLCAFFLLALPALAELPPGLAAITDYNQQLAVQTLATVSLFIAFLAGLTSIFSPCILPILPAYLASTFQDPHRLVRATLFFFLGFAGTFVSMGLIAAALGRTLVTLFSGAGWLVPLAGLVFIALGSLTLSGHGFASPFASRDHGRARSSAGGMLGTGALFALGWTACIGPVLSSVLLMAAVIGHYGKAALLMMSYSMGIFVPLFLLAILFRGRVSRASWVRRQVRLRGRDVALLSVVSGAIYILIGLVFVFYGGTWKANGFNMFGLKDQFYGIQRWMLANDTFLHGIGALLLVALVASIIIALRRENQEVRQ